MPVSILAEGFAAIQKRLNALELATNTEDVLDVAGAFILNQIKTRFLRQEATDGTTWEVSQAAKKRQSGGIGGGTLFDTGDLFNSIELSRGGPGVRIISTNLPYAAQHQFGLEVDGFKFPKREFLGISEEDEQGVRNIIEDRIRLAIR
jgi:phage virion morphogenesis protein